MNIEAHYYAAQSAIRITQKFVFQPGTYVMKNELGFVNSNRTNCEFHLIGKLR